MRTAPAYFNSRYTAVMAVKVLPAPVAMWISARGLLDASERSRPWTAPTWQSRSLSTGSGGMLATRRPRKVSGCASHSRNCTGWKK